MHIIIRDIIIIIIIIIIIKYSYRELQRSVSSSFAPPFVLLILTSYIHSSSYSQSAYNWRCNHSSSSSSFSPRLFLFVFFLHRSLSRDADILSGRISKREMVIPLFSRRGAAERTWGPAWPGRLKVDYFGFSKSYMTGNFLSSSSSRS